MKKTILVTGASSGFGKEIVKLFHARGWQVIATMRDPGRAEGLPSSGDVFVARLDVTDPASISAAVQAGIGRFGGIDVVVNNAGYGTLGVLEAASTAGIRQQLDVNLFGMIDVIKAVLPGMRARRSGVIVNVSSMGGRLAFPYSTLYHATKYAVEGLTESLQYELNPLGIFPKLIEPGGYKTEFTGRSMGVFGDGGIADYAGGYQQFSGLLSSWPLNERIEEVAEAVYLAATDGSETLRYPVGQDAVQLLEARLSMDDIAFKKMMAGQLGI